MVVVFVLLVDILRVIFGLNGVDYPYKQQKDTNLMYSKKIKKVLWACVKIKAKMVYAECHKLPDDYRCDQTEMLYNFSKVYSSNDQK